MTPRLRALLSGAVTVAAMAFVAVRFFTWEPRA